MAKSRNKGKANNSRSEEQREKNDSMLQTKITLGFDFFLGQDSKGVGQTWEDWNQNKLIVPMLNKLKHICALTPGQAKEEGSLKIYGEFPKDSEFKCPESLKDIDSWGTIRKWGMVEKHVLLVFMTKIIFFE